MAGRPMKRWKSKPTGGYMFSNELALSLRPPRYGIAGVARQMAREVGGGDIVGFAAIVIKRDGTCHPAWYGGPKEMAQLCGAAASLSHQLSWSLTQAGSGPSWKLLPAKQKPVKRSRAKPQKL